MPDDWQPSDATKQHGRSIGLPNAEIDADLQRFKTHHTRIKPGLSADWQASACGWLDLNKLAHKPAPASASKPFDDGKVFVEKGTSAFEAWNAEKRKRTGFSCDEYPSAADLPGSNGRKGWRFDSEYPVSAPQNEREAAQC